MDGGDEDVYYHTLKEGKVTLSNPDYGITVEMAYDTEVFPVTLEWKSMISGDYALGIEPSITRFDNFQMRTLNPKENKNPITDFAMDYHRLNVAVSRAKEQLIIIETQNFIDEYHSKINYNNFLEGDLKYSIKFMDNIHAIPERGDSNE